MVHNEGAYVDVVMMGKICTGRMLNLIASTAAENSRTAMCTVCVSSNVSHPILL